MDGFERFAQGQLLTVFSATNYCGTANNAGAILVLGRDLTLYPKLIHLPSSDRHGVSIALGSHRRQPLVTRRQPRQTAHASRGRLGQTQPIGLINPT